MNASSGQRGARCVVRKGRASLTARHAPRGGLVRWLVVCLAGFAGTVYATNLPPATVSFLDGSFLRGELQSLDADTLQWRHPNARAPIEFSTTNLNLIRLPQRGLVGPTNVPPTCRILLAGGDEFEGNLLALDAESFEVDTWFAGRLRGRRSGLQSLAFYGHGQSAAYDGPRTADEWTVRTGAESVTRPGVELLIGRNLELEPGAQVVPAAAPVQVQLLAPPAPAERLPDAAGLAAQQRVAAEISRQVNAALELDSGARLLKSDLMQAAVDAGVASRKAEEEWLEQRERGLEQLAEDQRARQLKLVIQAEATLLGVRLLKARAPAVAEGAGAGFEQTRERALAMLMQQAWIRAAGNALADVLAQARERALGALRLNDLNVALPVGAEAALVGAAMPATNREAWNFRDGAYYATAVGTLGRECHLPTKARIEFELAWKGQPYFRFSCYTRSTEHFDFSDGWQFYTSSTGFIYSMRRSGQGPAGSGGARVPQMVGKNSVRFTLLVNTEAETAVLLADGERVHEWKHLGSPGPGTGIVFYNYNPSSRVRVSDIRVAPWDGRERGTAVFGEDGATTPSADSALVEFVNNDRATGPLHGIRDGKLIFDPAGTKLEIPLARAAVITFPVADASPLSRPDGVQVTLHRNERLTLALEKWGAAEVVAVSPVLGRLKLRPEAVRALRFNPTAPRGAVDEWSGP